MISLLPATKQWFVSDNPSLANTHPQVAPLLHSLLVMAWMVEARDPYTGGHLWRVSQYCRLLAASIGLEKQQVARIALGGFLHDLGKIGVPDTTLKKPVRLSDQEYETIKTHPQIGARLLVGHPLASLVQTAILHHHERPDGAGYPYGLDESDLSVDSRIVSICDAFDAMTSTRPYRRGMSRDQALQGLKMNLHTQFDGNFGHLFIELGREGRLNHILGHSDLGIPLQACPLCGPTIVIHRNQKTGDYVYCQNCGAEAVIEKDKERLRTHPTGHRGSPDALQPKVDFDIIDDFVTASAPALAVE
ncbi:MAG: HD domain-containing protein [Candidatus Thiodiazotropha sp. (ex Epidulcina cf. delphinae)]|nr:HD domain-containing protein [Candidatus Thiodiazotropha sp. (ex Epidulcina cf. delphinae)]